MKKYNVVLLGGSNSVMVNGLQKGLRQENINLTNLALGATTSIQNLYELKRERNQKIIYEADLIITESNINEINHNLFKAKLSLSLINRNLNWLYEELCLLSKKVVIIILPVFHGEYKIINNIHKKLGLKYSFNVIDLSRYYIANYLQEFSKRIDPIHPNEFVMRELGKNIAKNINSFKMNFNKYIVVSNPSFLEFIPNRNFHVIKKTNSMYDECVCAITNKYNIISHFYWKIIAIHTWNNGLSNIMICNNKDYIFKALGGLNCVVEFQKILTIDENTYCQFTKLNKEFTESTQQSSFSKNNKQTQNSLEIVAFLLASPEGNYHTEEVDFEALANEIIEIPKEYDFNHLIPPIKWYKEIIDEYCFIMDPKKLAPLQTQITNLTNEKQNLINEKTNLQNQLNQFQNTLNSLPIKKQQLEISNLEQDLINKKLQTKQLSKKLGIKMNDFMPKIIMINPNSAKARIQNQLSYKLGQAMIVNSKSVLGYIRMPFVLSYIKDKHKQEQKIYQEKIKKDPSLKLPPLESYPDYKEALKLKNHLSYKLGEALIQANKTWYGGGYIKLLFEIRKLKNEFKKM
ncbi:hypothetical protein O8I41_05875 [Campylobacter lari]|uniref:hypothetical protein n=1 Tax=Campylobacter lari TaxID=201 RepID=UPI003729DCFB